MTPANRDRHSRRTGYEMPVTGGGDAPDSNPSLRLLLLDPFVWEDVPADLEERVVRAATAATAATADIADTAPPELAVARMRSTKQAWPRRVLLGAVAALVAVAVGIAWPNGDDTRTVELAGTELAPGASGTVVVDERGGGVGFTLDVSGLAPAPEDHFYQAWVKGDEGPVAIGTFHLRQGDDRVDLWSGVDLDEYPTLTVTLQEEGAGPESSGRVVLMGKVG